ALWNWGKQWANTANYPGTNTPACDQLWCIDSFAGVVTGVSTAIHFWEGGYSGFNNVPEKNTFIGSSLPTCEDNAVIWMVGRGREMGYPTAALLSWVAPMLISQATDPGYNPWLLGAYRIPVKDPITGQYYTTWAQVKSQMCTGTADGCSIN